jgi:predicted alpha/beta-hydrolase family hydrolase
VLLAHGAGADLDAAPLRAVAAALAGAGIPSLRFNFPYRDAGRRAPDRPPVLLAAVRDAAARRAKRVDLPAERLVLGGRSMGGRMCTLLVGAPPDEDPIPALGLLLLGYPLHPAGRARTGRPAQLRTEHFPRLRVPCLFVSGTRDALAGHDALTAATKAIKGRVRFEWLDTADHGFRPLKASGMTGEDVLRRVAEASTAWVAGLPAG